LKRLTAIFFIVLFLFNLCGYRLLFYYAQQKSDANYNALLDKEEYNESDLITLKVDLNMPYQTERADFERVDGEIDVNGIIYKYVKRKIHHGQLVLLCLPDQQKMKLQSAREDFFKISNSLIHDKGAKDSPAKSFVCKNVSSDYDQNHSEYKFIAIASQIKYSVQNDRTHLISSYHSSPEQPPELA
jgi:hypothetical protein